MLITACQQFWPDGHWEPCNDSTLLVDSWWASGRNCRKHSDEHWNSEAVVLEMTKVGCRQAK